MAVEGQRSSFHVLGPVQIVVRGAPVAFRRPQQRDLTAWMLLRVGRLVTVDQLVDAIWGEAPPQSARIQISNMISGLRSLLAGAAVVDRQAGGYQLRIVDGELDLTVFTDLTAQARASTDPVVASTLWRQALQVWTGDRPLTGVRAPFATAARAHLEELRLAALEALFDAELQRGSGSTIVPEVRAAVDAYPSREHFVGQLMMALYRAGRTSEALEAFSSARKVLVQEYGIEPGTALQDLERLILRSEPLPLVTVDTTDSGAAQAAPPAQLPLAVASFSGRHAEVARLDKILHARGGGGGAVAVSVVTGTAGVGKTTLAVYWAHRVADRFPDGQLYVDLHGFDATRSPTGPAEALRGFLDALGVPAQRIPVTVDAQAAMYRSQLSGRRILVVLDNAATAEQVRPLLPGSAGCLVVVTSRNRLAKLIASEGGHPILLDLPNADEAHQMLVHRLGADRVVADPASVEAIIARCARLPLALAMVAARAATYPDFPLATLADQLASHGSDADVRTAFGWSVRQLPAAAARLFRLLGLHPGPDFTEAAAASLAGVAVDVARRHLDELARTHLVAERVPGRYAMHDLLREYARELAIAHETEADRLAATHRTLDHYLHTAHAAARKLSPQRTMITLVPPCAGVTPEPVADHGAAHRWFAAEHAVLLASVDQAVSAGVDVHAWQLPWTLSTYLDRDAHWRELAESQATALAAARRLADPVAESYAHRYLGSATSMAGERDGGRTHLLRALELAEQVGDPGLCADTHLFVGGFHERAGRHRDALEHARRAYELIRDVDDSAAGNAQNSIGWTLAQLGEHDAALAACEEALRLNQRAGDRYGEVHVWDSLGWILRQMGEYGRAATSYRSAAGLLRDLGYRYREAVTLQRLADACSSAGDAAGATDALREASRILDDLGKAARP